MLQAAQRDQSSTSPSIAPCDSHGGQIWKDGKCSRIALLQICFFSADAGKAFTTVFAGFAATLTSLPNITLVPAFVAGFTRVLMRKRFGTVKIPFFFTSAAAMATKESSTSRHTFGFSSCSAAMVAVKSPFVMALPLLRAFIAFGAFIAFIAFMAFMGAIVLKEGDKAKMAKSLIIC